MSRRGDSWDNAVMESFFPTLKIERVHRIHLKRCTAPDDMRADVFDYIERSYNPRRRHSTLGQISPIEFETLRGLSKVSMRTGEAHYSCEHFPMANLGTTSPSAEWLFTPGTPSEK